MTTNAENQGHGENPPKDNQPEPTRDGGGIEYNPNPKPPLPGYERTTNILGQPIVDVYNPNLAAETPKKTVEHLVDQHIIDYYLPADVCYAATTTHTWDQYKTLQKQGTLPTPAKPEDIYLTSSNLLDKPGSHPAILVETHVYNLADLRSGSHTPQWKHCHLYQIGPDDTQQYQEDHNTELYLHIYEEAQEKIQRWSNLINVGGVVDDESLPRFLPEPAIQAIHENDEQAPGWTHLKLWNMKDLWLDAATFKPEPPQPPLTNAYLKTPMRQRLLKPLLRDEEAEQRENITNQRFNGRFNQQFDPFIQQPGETLTEGLGQQLRQAFRGAPTISQAAKQFANRWQAAYRQANRNTR